MAHTRQQQLELQAAINTWQQQQQQQQQSQQQQQQPLQQQQQQQANDAAVQPDSLAGMSLLHYQQQQSFGWPGQVVGAYLFISVPAFPGSSVSTLLHCRAPLAAAASSSCTLQGGFSNAVADSIVSYSSSSRRSAASSEQPGAFDTLPQGTVVLWNESDSSYSSSSSSVHEPQERPRPQQGSTVTIHSLAVSPCGSVLAVTSSSNRGRSWQLSVLDCSNGQLLLQPVLGVSGPVLWVTAGSAAAHTQDASPAAAAAVERLQQQRQQQQQHLVYVADDSQAVYCLPVSPRTTAPAAALPDRDDANVELLPAAQTCLVYKDPQHVSLSVAAAGGSTFIQVFGADGLVRQVLHYCSTSSTADGKVAHHQLLPVDPYAWQPLLPAAAVAHCLVRHTADISTGASPSAAAAAALLAAGDEDPTVRLAVTVLEDGWVLARRSCAAVPEGMLLLGRQQQQQLEWQLLLPPRPDLLLEAAFVCQQHQSRPDLSISTDSSSRLWQLVVLAVEHHQQQQQLQCGAKLGRQMLHAQLYTFELPVTMTADYYLQDRNTTQQQQQQQQIASQMSHVYPASLQLQCTCILPLPDAFVQLKSASWHPGCGELQVEFSSLVRPVSKLTVNLGQLAAQQQQQQDTASRQAVAQDSTQAQQHQQHEHKQHSPAETEAAFGSTNFASSLQHVQPSPPDFDQNSYETLQLHVPAADGALIPVSLAWNRHMAQLPQHLLNAAALAAARSGCTGEATAEDCTCIANSATGGSNSSSSSSSGSSDAAGLPPMLLSCYGSYGIREAVAFDPELLQLLDGGWLLAVAHVRGGGWLGRAWAEAGRGMGKATSVSDLLAVAGYIRRVSLINTMALHYKLMIAW
jgi:hypothetical protein